MDEVMFTCQTRLQLDERGMAILDEYAQLSNLVEHSLYAEVAKGKTSASCKNEFLKKFGITARQFNACRVSLEGKIASCLAGQEQALESLKQQIANLDKQIGLLAKKPSKQFVLHQKKRRKIKLSHRLSHLIEWAEQSKKPVVLEKLDFQKKKLALKEQSRSKFSRLLSSFAYGLFFLLIMARGYRKGITIHQVNPAYTSIIGRINFAKRYGLSIHLAAALCVARRYQKFSESPCLSKGKIPDGKGGHVAFVLPVRNRMKHVWHFWGKVKKKLKTVLAAHFQAIKNRSSGPLKPAHVTGTS